MPSLDELEHDLRSANLSDRAKRYVEYCEAIIKAYDSRQIDEYQMAERLMHGYGYDELRALGRLTPVNAITDEMLEIASYMDMLPYYPNDQDQEEDWKRLKQLIDEYKQQTGD